MGLGGLPSNQEMEVALLGSVEWMLVGFLQVHVIENIKDRNTGVHI